MLPDRVSNPGPLTYESGVFAASGIIYALLSKYSFHLAALLSFSFMIDM